MSAQIIDRRFHPPTQTAKRNAVLLAKATDPHEDALWVPVNILDAKFTFGHVNLLAEPVGGKGQQWVDLKRLQFEK